MVGCDVSFFIARAGGCRRSRRNLVARRAPINRICNMLSVLLAAAAFAPTPLRTISTVQPLRAPVAPAMSLDMTTIIADGEQGINGAFKAAVADALGPDLAAQAPLIGALLFVVLAALDLGVFKKKDEAPPAPPSAPPAE